MDHSQNGNDGVSQTSNMDTMPGESKTYVIKPRQPGTMYYHCHVQPHTHIPMGLQGLFVVEENRPNNWPQTLNVGAGQVRHPSVAVTEKYAREYDLHYQSVDKELHEVVARSANDPRLIAKYGKATPEALVESALWEASLFEEHGFSDIKISVKHHDPVTMVNAYRLLASKCDYPLHLGVTEAGPIFQGTIKSATAFGILLSEGIGDTIRVSLSAPPVEEVKVGISILESLNLRQRKLEIVSCPSCGRAQVDVYTLAEKVQAGLQGMTVPLRVAVMGCVVNGPGEAREADLGVASGNGKGQIFVKGQVIKTVPEAQIVETLIEEAMRLAEEMEAAGVSSGEPSVDVH
jgi:hypothetical protein